MNLKELAQLCVDDTLTMSEEELLEALIEAEKEMDDGVSGGTGIPVQCDSARATSDRLSLVRKVRRHRLEDTVGTS